MNISTRVIPIRIIVQITSKLFTTASAILLLLAPRTVFLNFFINRRRSNINGHVATIVRLRPLFINSRRGRLYQRDVLHRPNRRENVLKPIV